MARGLPLAEDPRQRRHIRRMAIVLGLISVAVYVAYVYYWMRHGHP